MQCITEPELPELSGLNQYANKVHITTDSTPHPVMLVKVYDTGNDNEPTVTHITMEWPEEDLSVFFDTYTPWDINIYVTGRATEIWNTLNNISNI